MIRFCFPPQSPRVETFNVTLVHLFVSTHRRANGRIGSVKLPHLFGRAPDVDVFNWHC
jgi:hypothetical protein